jgi:hypothetical protein
MNVIRLIPIWAKKTALKNASKRVKILQGAIISFMDMENIKENAFMSTAGQETITKAAQMNKTGILMTITTSTIVIILFRYLKRENHILKKCAQNMPMKMAMTTS